MSLIPAALEDFTQARFGLFVHYGLYSLLGRGEWVLNRERIPLNEYKTLADRFTAENFDADAICRQAKKAGMRYVCLTTMHHDGFCLYDSHVVSFNSMNAAAKRDLVVEFVEAARKYDLRISLYHSLNNWTADPDAVDALENRSGKSYDRFIEQTFARIRELVTKFNPIDVLWYDGWWPFHAEGWQAQKMNQMVREIQPHILFNNRNGLSGDFGTPEGHLSAPSPWRPWEACMTHNNHWGFHAADEAWKKPQEVVGMLASVAQGRGNLLLNIGPKPDGSIPEPSVTMLHEVGAWIDRCGESVFETDCFTFGLMERGDHQSEWSSLGVFTAKANNLYFLVTDWLSHGEFTLAGLQCKVQSVTLLGETSQKVSFTQTGERLVLQDLPMQAPDPICSVFRIECDREPEMYLTGGMRIPAVPHPPYDPCESDIAH